jgi:uncharacterized membrane protein YgdD (TMEM256/DUF423 family)
MSPDRLFVLVGSLYGGLGVAVGAFAAQALKTRLAPELLATVETAVRYQLVHALALLAAAWACTRWPGRWATAAGWLFAAGVLLFSGSLYALVASGVRGLGAITPFGGVAMISGWVCLALAAWRGR